MKKRKVLICYHSAQYGGVEKHILDIIKGLSASFEIHIACPAGPLVGDYVSAGAVRHHDLYPKFEADFIYSLKISELLRREKIDVIHSHELLTGSLATFGAWIAGTKKRIYHVHTSFTQWRHSGFKKYPALFINTIVNFVVGNFFATDVIALTKSVKNVRIRKEFIIPGKIRVIPNGIYLSQFQLKGSAKDDFKEKYSLDKNSYIIGNIARFTPEKGHEILIDSLRLLRESDPDRNYILVLAGGGSLLNDIQARVQNYNLLDKVILLGNFNEQDKSAILSSFDCFAFPSYAEGFGIALLEAMAIGLPCVSSDIAVLRDVGEDGVMYFASGSAVGLEEKVKALSSDRAKSAELSTRAREISKKYSMENFWKAYTNLYNS